MARDTADEKESAAAVAAAQVAIGEAAVKAARLNLEYCQIPLSDQGPGRPPPGGRRKHRQGNEEALVVIERLDPIFAEFTVTEVELTEVQRRPSWARSRSRCGCPTRATRGWAI